MKESLVLGIESSCDETAASIVGDQGRVLSSIVATQVELHARFGGVVPEIASRAHAERLGPVVRRALQDAGVRLGELRGIGVTNTPGLIGALLVGVSAAKALAWAADLPVVGVDHIEGHVHSVRMAHPALPDPHVVLVASGGHTRLYEVEGPGRCRILGSTLDDAAGEAFDKVASVLGLAYPGGPEIDRVSRGADREKYAFPRTRLGRESLDFSFSGLKTAVLYLVRGQGGKRLPSGGPPDVPIPDIAASFQEAVVDVLVEKLSRAARATGARAMAIAGGVACNSRLRERLEEAARTRGIPSYVPPRELCTDNAAMIAGLASLRLERGETDGLDFDAAA